MTTDDDQTTTPGDEDAGPPPLPTEYVTIPPDVERVESGDAGTINDEDIPEEVEGMMVMGSQSLPTDPSTLTGKELVAYNNLMLKLSELNEMVTALRANSWTVPLTVNPEGLVITEVTVPQ
jgi:hypothetical protein